MKLNLLWQSVGNRGAVYLIEKIKWGQENKMGLSSLWLTLAQINKGQRQT